MALTIAVINKLYAAGLDTLVISLDSTTSETQDRIRKGSNINRLIPKITVMWDCAVGIITRQYLLGAH